MSGPASVERAGDVTILRLTAGESRFNPTTLEAIEAALDELEGDDGPRASKSGQRPLAPAPGSQLERGYQRVHASRPPPPIGAPQEPPIAP